MDNSTVSSVTRKYLTAKQKQGLVESAMDEIPKSFVIYLDEGEYKICFSQLSTAALMGRLEQGY